MCNTYYRRPVLLDILFGVGQYFVAALSTHILGLSSLVLGAISVVTFVHFLNETALDVLAIEIIFTMNTIKAPLCPCYNLQKRLREGESLDTAQPFCIGIKTFYRMFFVIFSVQRFSGYKVILGGSLEIDIRFMFQNALLAGLTYLRVKHYQWTYSATWLRFKRPVVHTVEFVPILVHLTHIQ